MAAPAAMVKVAGVMCMCMCALRGGAVLSGGGVTGLECFDDPP